LLCISFILFFCSLFLQGFIVKGSWILSLTFSSSVHINMGFLSLILFMYYILCLLNCICWAIHASMEWNDLFNVLLNSICKYFIENFCIYVHQINWTKLVYHFLSCPWDLVIRIILASYDVFNGIPYFEKHW
jgi:hypothetical protein